MTIRPEVIDELLKDCSDPREVLAEGGLIRQLTKAIMERCLEAELDTHLGYPKHGRRSLFAFSADIRKVIYTTNAIESVNMTLRKVTRNHRIFPSDEVVYKVVYLAIRTIARKWTMPIHNWKPALNGFAIEFAGRLPNDENCLHKILDRLRVWLI